MGSDITAKIAYLPVDTPIGDAYINWMNLALRFARENRAKIMARVREIFLTEVEKYTSFTDIELEEEINAHHNYAALEHHYGEHVWVHRKGAIRAGKGELGIIPGAMGSYSYIVRGSGEPGELLLLLTRGRAGNEPQRKKERNTSGRNPLRPQRLGGCPGQDQDE